MTKRTFVFACIVILGLAAASRADGEKASVDVTPALKRWAADGEGGTPGFTRHVQPLLAKLGCNGRACHGSFQGQGGFRLSLFGSDPKLDVDELMKGTKGPRLDVKEPDKSLALRKGTR